MARWRGPGIVAGEVGGNYWVSMPGSFVKCSPEQLRLRTASEREADRFLVRDIRAAAAQLFPEVGVTKNTQKNFIDITKDDLPPGDLCPDSPTSDSQQHPMEMAEQPDQPEQADRPSQPSVHTNPPVTISSSLSDQLDQLSPDELNAWRESAERANRLDGRRRPQGPEPEPKRLRPEQRVGGQVYPQTLLPSPPTREPAQVPIPVSSGSSDPTSSSTSSSSSHSMFVDRRQFLDSAALNVGWNEQGSEEQEWVLAVDDSCGTEDNVLLAGGRKEINLKEMQWGTQQGKDRLVKGIRKEVKNCIEDKPNKPSVHAHLKSLVGFGSNIQSGSCQAGWS